MSSPEITPFTQLTPLSLPGSGYHWSWEDWTRVHLFAHPKTHPARVATLLVVIPFCQARKLAAEKDTSVYIGHSGASLSSCHQKCIPKTYIESDLDKDKAICIDRCVSKFF
ncbi:hypothetical protein EDD21DRAFT_445273 [Dissophora ornata]|nr:hypothetical protein EDD21DRAFT_445273 [Dissophora ornata]